MARINIEDSILKDPRFIDYCILCGCRSKAMGNLFFLWQAAQKFFLSHGEIPIEDFLKLNLDDGLIRVGLAERTETGVRARGQKEQFSWLLQKSEAGKKGGLKSVESRIHEYGTSHPNPEAGASENQKRAKAGVKRAEASLLSSPSSLLSNTKNLNTVAVPPSEEPPPKRSKSKEILPSASQNAWQSYRDAFIRRYQSEPIRNAMVNGQLSNLISRVGREAAPDLLAFYVQSNDAFYVRSGHTIGIALKDCEKLATEVSRAKQGIAKPSENYATQKFRNETKSLIESVLGEKINGAKKSNAD